MPKTKIDFSNIQVLEQGLSPENQGEDLLELSDKDTAKIRKALKGELTAWENETATLAEKLQHWYDLSEGIIDDSDEPYPDAFHTHIDLVGIYLKVYASIERRSILGPEVLWYAEADPEFDDIQDQLSMIDEMMNYKARAEWNINEAMGECFPCANRDGLVVLKIPQVEEVEEMDDKILLHNLDDLDAEFPPAESGLTPKEYRVLAQLVEQNATDETPVEVPVTQEQIIYSGPKAYVVERINFVTFPSNARSLDREYCRGHGDRFVMRREEVRQKMESKEWYEDACKEFLKKTGKSGGTDPTSYRTNQETITGINRGAKADEHEFFELVFWMRLEGKGIEKKYVFIYSKEQNILMFAKKYWYRIPTYYTIFRIERRANQIDGRSVVGQLEFLNENLDLLYNMNIQGWQIANIPSFKVEKSLDEEFDLEAEENLWHPGVVFHMPVGTFDKFIQFDVRPTDNGGIMNGEKQLLNYAALIMGIDAFLASGRPSPENPDAPGNKTALLVNQGNIRMEDPLSELRYGVEAVGAICLSHLYQFGPPIIQYKGTEGKQKVTKYIPKKLLRTGVRLKMQGVTVVMNSENEFRKGIEKWGIVVKEPLVAQKAKYRLAAMHRAFRDGRVPNFEDYLPSLEEAQAYDVETSKQALLKMMMEQKMQQAQAAQAQAQAQQQQKVAMMGALADKVKTHNLIKKLSENNLAAQLQGVA